MAPKQRIPSWLDQRQDGGGRAAMLADIRQTAAGVRAGFGGAYVTRQATTATHR